MSSESRVPELRRFVCETDVMWMCISSSLSLPVSVSMNPLPLPLICTLVPVSA